MLIYSYGTRNIKIVGGGWPMPRKGQKLNISPEGHAIRSRCGRENLTRWRKENPDKPPNLQHGANSQIVRARFDDGRTAQGRALAASLKNLTDHFGGADAITAPMQLLINSYVRPRLITLMCISDYINRQIDVIDDEGKVLGCLDQYHRFSNSLRDDIKALQELAREAGLIGKSGQVPTIADIINKGK